MMQEQDKLNNGTNKDWKQKQGYGRILLIAVVAFCGLVAAITHSNSVTAPVGVNLIRSGGSITGSGGGEGKGGVYWIAGIERGMDRMSAIKPGDPCYDQFVACNADSDCSKEGGTATDAGKALVNCLLSD